MYQIEDQIRTTEFNGLKPVKLASKEACETILIVLEKGHTFPEHTAPRDALLVMLEGSIIFYINNEEYKIKKHQSFSFPAKVAHEVLAEENSKFLIVR